MTNNKTRILFSFVFLILVNCYPDCPYEIIDRNEDTYFSRLIILFLHNYYRRQISRGLVDGQPKSKAPLTALTWDNSLAVEAQKVSDTCVFDNIEVNSMGQNVFISCSLRRKWGFNWRKAIDFWFDENEQYNYPANANEQTGHYTQMVWEETEFIGCGGTHYEREEEEAEILFCKLYVCNYAPAGNALDQPPYIADMD